LGKGDGNVLTVDRNGFFLIKFKNGLREYLKADQGEKYKNRFLHEDGKIQTLK
jgi:hypothetical protein